jgi:3D-(3,5/4)-trihydroxycyclohexane-1,2-dione acylhydrolase (decyclizing)
MTSTVKHTVARAMVLYLQRPYSEFDRKRKRLIAGMFGIFGHGNVAGMGKAVEEYGTAQSK